MGFRIDKLKLHSGHQNYPVLYASDNERFVGQNQHGWFRIGAANSSHLHMETDRDNFYFYNSIQNAVNIKAPMYYDINNTAFYVNPASTSNLNGLKTRPIMLSGAQNFDSINLSGFYNLYNTDTNTGSTNSPGFSYGTMLVVGNALGSGGFGFQLAHQRTNTAGGLRVRGMNDNNTWSSWATVHTSLDFTNNSANWNTAYGWGDHAGLYANASHSHAYLPLTGGTLTGSTILKGKSYLDGSHGDARFQIRRQDITTESEKSYLTLWASEPGITHSSAGIGGNINSSGQYYGRQSTGAGWGAYLRFNVASGHNEFWSTTGNPGAGAGAGSKTFYVDGSGNSYAVTSSRAPIFYDSNDTAFYVNPAGTSRMSRIEISSTYYLTLGADISLNANGSVRGEYFVGSKAATNGYTVYKGYDNYNHFLAIRGYARPNQGKNKSSVAGGHQTSFVEYAEANSTTGWFFMSSSGTNYEQVAKITKSHSEFVSSVHSPRFYDLDDTTYYVRPGDISYINSLDIDSSLDVLGNTYTVGLISSAASMRAPIFYDTNNTNYYMNPHAVSNVVTIQSNSGDSFISKLSGTKSWLKHITIGALVFAPSASNNGSDWSWANEVRFSSNGTITSNGNITRSDERLKTKITDLPCDNIDVAWKSYELKSDEGEKRVGVIAQELEETHPEFVITDSEGFKSVKYIDLLIAKIAELEARLEKLEQ